MKKIILNLLIITLFSIIAIFMFCTNTYAANDTGELEMILDVDDTNFDVSADGYLDTEKGVEFIYTIELKDTEENPVNATYNATITDCIGTRDISAKFTDGIATVKVHGADATLNIFEIPVGYTYNITGADTNRYYIIEDEGTTGTIENEKKTARFDCTVNTGDVTLKLYMSGDNAKLDWPVRYVWYSYYRYPTPRYNIKYTGDRSGEVAFDGSRYTFIIPMKDGETVVLKDLPMSLSGNNGNTRYDEILISDTGRGAYTGGWADGTGNSGAVVPSIAFRGYRNPFGPVVISKNYTDNSGEKDKEFTFKLKAEAVQKVEGDETVTTPINKEFGYAIREKVEEEDPNDPTQTITVNKTVEEGKVQFDENGECFVKIKEGQTIQVGLYNNKHYDENGNEVKGTDDWVYVDYDFFLNGDKVTVEEVDSDGYDVEVEANTSGAFVYHFLNTRKFTGKLAISKIVEGETAETNKEFRFKIKLEDTAGSLPNTYTYTGSKEGTIEFDENREAEITLKHGEKITIEGLPVGAKYIVTEDDYQEEGYKTETKNEEGIITEEGSLAEFTNTKQPEKDVEDEPEEQPEEKEEDSKEEEQQSEEKEDSTKEIVEEKEESTIEENVEEKKEVKQVQTGDVVTRAVTVLIIATIAFGTTFIRKRNK